MALQRVQFADSADGTINNYTLILNPVSVNVPHSVKSDVKKSKETIDGETIVFEPFIDTRRCQLIWSNIPYNYYIGGNNIQDQFNTLESYVNKYKYINLGDIGYALGVFQAWTKIKVISLDKTLDEGGRLKYNKVVFVFELAE